MLTEQKLRELASEGKITEEVAKIAISRLNAPFPRVEIIEAAPPKQRRAMGLMAQSIRHAFGETFNHNNAERHYEQRMDLEEGVRHILGLPVYGLIAAVDALVDAAGFGASEIVEDLTFTTGRIIYKAKDGWNRSKIT